MLILRKVWSYEMSNEQVVEDLDLISSIKFPARDQTENIVQQLIKKWTEIWQRSVVKFPDGLEISFWRAVKRWRSLVLWLFQTEIKK